MKQKADFDPGFEFDPSVSAEGLGKNWDDLSKYVKRKAKTKTDDKIKKILGSQTDETEAEVKLEKDEDEEYSLSEDELQYDKIKEKKKKKIKRKLENGRDKEERKAEELSQEADVDVEDMSFYQMNLSRPLMKAIDDMMFIHPTPIQAATIPVALKGEN